MTSRRRKHGLGHYKIIDNDDIRLELEFEGKEVYIKMLYAKQRGAASKILTRLTEMADRCNYSLRLLPIPLTPIGEGIKLGTQRLRRFYRRHGFKGTEIMRYNHGGKQ